MACCRDFGLALIGGVMYGETTGTIRQLVSAVTLRISSEVQIGRLVGPLPPYLFPLIHTSPIGLVPKPHSDKFRMIVDLSAPRGHGVNDGIGEESCSLRYASVDQAVSLILRLGQGTKLVKVDLQDAYRIVPVHPQDHPLLGICWEGATYIDRSLPFGLRSAPKIFTAVADMFAWAIHCNGVRYILHYLDDFLLLGAPGSSETELALTTTTHTFETLGVPVATHKTEGPAPELTFLGILIDTNKFQLRLPADKLNRLRLMVTAWRSKRVCTRHDLESFVGHLSHAATVVLHARIFLRPLFALMAATSRLHPLEPISLRRLFLPGLERLVIFPASISVRPRILRRLWHIWVRSIRHTAGLVPVSMVRGVGGEKYSDEGTDPSGGSGSPMGQSMGGQTRLFPLRQYGGSRNPHQTLR